MEQRDRLIELIDDFVDTVDVKHWYSEELDEPLADHILADGWIRLPCKVGDMVYVIEPCTCYNNYSEKCHHRRTKATKYIDIVQLPKKHHKKCLKLFERPFKIEYLNKIGKTVFLTREEAEQKLKGE